jgi:hypothetical protein
MKTINVFIASPSDITEERDAVDLVVRDLNSTIGDLLNINLVAIKWETHAWPDVGNDAQDVINKEINDYDVFVGIMWKRFGTPTKRGNSGTGEEFKRAYDYFRKFGRPKIMFYFKNKPFYSTGIEEIKQFQAVIEFRKVLEEFGVLFWQYTENIEFERNLRIHLSNQIKSITKNYEKVKTKVPKIFISYKRADLSRVETIYDMLKSRGFNPWMDVRDILAGKIWTDEIKRNIKSSDFFITVISNNSVLDTFSETGFSITQELDLAKNTFRAEEHQMPNIKDLPVDSYIIPLRVDKVLPPPELSKYQWLDYFEPNGPEILFQTINKLFSGDS